MDTDVAVGFYGKLPSHGDFLRRGVPDLVLERWDAWLQDCLAASQMALGDRWLDLYLTAPMWRFFAPAGALNPERAVAGVMFPSMDRVGRYFPVTVFAVMARGPVVGLLVAERCAGWFAHVEELVLLQLDEGARPIEEFQQAIAATAGEFMTSLSGVGENRLPGAAFPATASAIPHYLHVPLDGRLDLGDAALTWLDAMLGAAPPIHWWTSGSARVRPSWLLTTGLPDPLAFSAMLAGDWTGWPWASCTLPSVLDSTLIPGFHLDSAGVTHPGSVRSENQDAYLARPEAALWAVADGMGGHADGQLASLMAHDALAKIPPQATLAQSIEAVRKALSDVNDYLFERSQRDRDPILSGSTIVVLLTRGAVGTCLWAGDSRLYRYRDGRAEQLTTDHSEAQEAAGQGRNAPSNVITRALGGQSPLELDQVSFDIRLGDRFLLCSDGLYRDLPDADLLALLATGNAVEAAENLLEQVLRGPAQDNVTVVVIDVRQQVAAPIDDAPNPAHPQH